ncbi:MAG: MFS transporter [Reinekea sp.]|nr:MFS transporter [Reinekea sp.]
MTQHSQPKNGPLLAVLFFGVLMGALDIAIVAPALHPIQEEFGISPRLTSWIFSIYLLFSLIGTPLMAKLADIYGRRLVYIVDIILFGVGSLVVISGGLTHNFWLFLIGRGIQGLGAGGIFPVASAVIGDTVAPEKRGAALGMIGAVWGLAFILGPILGGLLIGFGWPALFMINIPMAIVLVIASYRFLPAHEKGDTPPLDLRALLSLSAALVFFSLAINRIDINDLAVSFSESRLWSYVALSAIFLVGLIISERRKVANPLFPHELFRNGQLKLVYILGFIYGLVQASVSFLPALAMATFSDSGLTAARSSYLLLPMVFFMAFASPMVGKLVDKVGSKWLLMFGVSIASVGFFILGFHATTLAWYIVGEIFVGLGIACLSGSPLRYVVLAESPAKDRTIAQGLSTLFISVGSVLGSALIGGVAASFENPQAGWSFAFLVLAVPTALAIGLVLMMKNKEQEQAALLRNR